MSEKKAPSRRETDSRGGKQQTGGGRSVQENKQPIRRNDVIRCENCGEDYSVTYKRCPFCDERPGRTGVGGRRVSEGVGRTRVHPVQLIGLVVSMVLIIAALFIVIKYAGPLFFGGGSGGDSSSAGSQSSGVSSSAGTSQSSSSAAQSGSSSGGDVSIQDPVVAVTSLTLNKTDITLVAGETYLLEAAVSPAEAPVTWASSDETILKIQQDGTITNVNATGSKVKVTVTATAGDKTASCTVYCNSSGTATQQPSGGGQTDTQQPGGSASAVNQQGVITGAGSGLNIRSGPGSSYEKIASAENGSGVTVLEDTGTGWYKIDYGNGKIGYASKDFIKLK